MVGETTIRQPDIRKSFTRVISKTALPVAASHTSAFWNEKITPNEDDIKEII
jgi:hypothetical protein